MAALAAIGAAGTCKLGEAMATTDKLEEMAFAAWLYVLPLIEIADARVRLRPDGQQTRVNALTRSSSLAGPQSRFVTTPNNDTLYANAFIDLTNGPVTIELPKTGRRYVSVAVLDMYTNVDVVLGTRTTGGEGGIFRLIGPHDSPRDARDLRLATPHGWLMARVLVNGQSDIEAARRVQDRLVVSGPDCPRPSRYATRKSEWSEYFRSAQRLLESDPPTFMKGHEALEAVRRAGSKGDFDRAGYRDSDAAAIDSGVERARALVQSARLRPNFIQGWSYPSPDIGNYGDRFIYRAAIAVAGLGALPREEAMYMRAAGDGETGLFMGDGLYRLSLKQPIPVSGFWSLTMYEATLDGQFFLTANVLKRYSIGEHTTGLMYNTDGSLDIWIGRHDPGEERRANWLPAPAAAPFALTLRAYLPGRELLEGSYRLPAITPEAS